MRALIVFVALVVMLCYLIEWRVINVPISPAKTETLSCVRVKEVTPAGMIKYYCEVRK